MQHDAQKRALGALLLLEPSCLFAMVALVPRALAAPSPSTYAALALVGLVACAPIVFLAIALGRPLHAPAAAEG